MKQPSSPGARLLRLLVIVGLVAACGSGSIVPPAHAIKPIMPEVVITAKLVLENGCPFLDDSSGTFLPIWPQGANIQGQTLRMRDAPVADVGEIVRLGGRWLGRAELAKDLLDPLPTECSGNGRVFWVQTFELSAPDV